MDRCFRHHRNPRGRRGATAVEFAMTVPVFLVAMMSIFDMSWVFMQQSALDSSANIGCRAGALVDPGIGEAKIDDVQEAAEEAMWSAMSTSGGGECTDDTCSVEVEVFSASPGRSLKCTVHRDFTPLIGMVVNPVTMTSNQAVRLEWQRD